MPILDQDAFSLYDASLVWSANNGKLRIGLHGKNLTNERYKIAGYNFPDAAVRGRQQHPGVLRQSAPDVPDGGLPLQLEKASVLRRVFARRAQTLRMPAAQYLMSRGSMEPRSSEWQAGGEAVDAPGTRQRQGERAGEELEAPVEIGHIGLGHAFLSTSTRRCTSGSKYNSTGKERRAGIVVHHREQAEVVFPAHAAGWHAAGRA